MNRRRMLLILIALILMAFFISGCAVKNEAQDTPGTAGVAGFWPGLWHGLILPVSFIASLFDGSIGIYEIHNNGNWYNFGFMLGAHFVFGSLLANKKRCK